MRFRYSVQANARSDPFIVLLLSEPLSRYENAQEKNPLKQFLCGGCAAVAAASPIAVPALNTITIVISVVRNVHALT